jgi:hypothetical protein
MCYIFCPSYFSKSIQRKLLYVTVSVSLGWQKVWTRSHAQPKWWVMRYQVKKKTACWPRERAAMSMIDRRPQIYTCLFLHRLRRCFKSSSTCVWNTCQLPFTRIAHSWNERYHFNFYLQCFKKPSATLHSVCLREWIVMLLLVLCLLVIWVSYICKLKYVAVKQYVTLAVSL